MEIVTPKSLRDYFTAKLNSWRSYSHLEYEYVNIRRVWNFSFIMVNDYPEIPLLADNLRQEIKKNETSVEMIQQAVSTLKREEDHENWLLLLLISKYCLYPGTLVLIRFEDFGTGKDGKHFLNILSPIKKRYEAISIDDETFEAVCKLQKSRFSCRWQKCETKRSWGKDLKIKGWFIFPVQRCLIGRRLQNGFNGRIAGFSSSPQKIISMYKKEQS